MGCPDLPKCFGNWIPPTNVSQLPPDFEKYLRKQDIDHSFNVWHTWIEYFNRLLGALLGIFAIIQVALLFKRRESLRTAWRLSILFLLIVIVTGLFGALVVKLNLAHLSISIHLLFALALIQIQLALVLSVQSGLSMLRPDNKIKKWLIVFIILLFIQSALGTMVRMYVDDVSKTLRYEQRETWLADSPIAFFIHRTFSWIVLLTCIFMAWLGRNTALRNNLFMLTGIVLLSMITGITLFYADMPAVAQPIHLLLATLAFTQCFSILLKGTVHNNIKKSNV
jgi:cytochrome c oxidase assembly protein subunit 15